MCASSASSVGNLSAGVCGFFFLLLSLSLALSLETGLCYRDEREQKAKRERERGVSFPPLPTQTVLGLAKKAKWAKIDMGAY